MINSWKRYDSKKTLFFLEKTVASVRISGFSENLVNRLIVRVQNSDSTFPMSSVHPSTTWRKSKSQQYTRNKSNEIYLNIFTKMKITKIYLKSSAEGFLMFFLILDRLDCVISVIGIGCDSWQLRKERKAESFLKTTLFQNKKTENKSKKLWKTKKNKISPHRTFSVFFLSFLFFLF